MGKHYTDRDRLDMVKKYRQSTLGLSEFASIEILTGLPLKTGSQPTITYKVILFVLTILIQDQEL
jgi:hypothetical protein